MAIYYIDTTSFDLATAVWAEDTLTTKAPDGFYSFGGDYREQVGGFLGATTFPCAAPPTTEFCYDGLWVLNDPVHPGGGSVTYVNNLGIQTTLNQIWMDYPVSIQASSIISTSGVEPIVCNF